MAKTIGLYSLAAPTNLALSLVDGGSLAPNTTYYYQILACQSKFGSVVFSPRTATVSITTSDTKKSIKLDWTAIPGYSPTGAENNSYHILRNTSDSFLDVERVLMMEGSSDSVSKRVTTNTFTDTGVDDVDHYFPNFKGGLPTIYVTTGANEWVSMYDIYLADIAGSWGGRVLPAVNTAFVDYGSDKITGGNWYSVANIAIGYDSAGAAATGYFSHLAGAITVWGAMSSSASAYVKWGLLANTEDANPNLRSFLITYGAYFQSGTLNGVLSLYGLSNTIGGYGFLSDYFQYNNNGYNTPVLNPSVGSVIYDCDFPFVLETKGTATNKGCRFGGIRFASVNHSPVGAKMSAGEGLGLRHTTGQTVVEPKITYAQQDIIWGTNLTQIVIDGTFLSHNRTDNQPWMHLGYTVTGGGTLTFKNTLKLHVKDNLGANLSGAAIVIKNFAGTTVSSGSTGADGKYDAGALINRILTGVSGNYGAALEDTHVASGYITRVLSNPHTLTITKAGYQDYRDVITIDRKMDLEVAMKRIEQPPGPWEYAND